MVCNVWRDSVAIVSRGLGITFLILNIFIPGLGTMLSSWFDQGDLNTDQLLIGIFQLFTIKFHFNSKKNFSKYNKNIYFVLYKCVTSWMGLVNMVGLDNLQAFQITEIVKVI